MMNRNKLPCVAEAASSGEHGDGQSSDDKWDTMYKKLEQFHAVHGHSNVPSRYPEDPALGFWVSTQRRQFRRLTDAETEQSAFVIHPERKKKLEELQFQFSAKDPNSLSWEERFRQLKDFKLKYGHALVPIKWKENPQLASWVSRQRQEHRHRAKGLTSRLTDERIQLLDSLGFVWEPKRGAPRREECLLEAPRAAGDSNHQNQQGLPNMVPTDDCIRAALVNQVRSEASSTSAMGALMASLEQKTPFSGRAQQVPATPQGQQRRVPVPSPVNLHARASLTLPAHPFLPQMRQAESSVRDRLLETAIRERIAQLSAEEARLELRRLSLSSLLETHSNPISPSTHIRPIQRELPMIGTARLSLSDPTGLLGPLAQSSRNVATLAASSPLVSGISQLPMSAGANNFASFLTGNRATTFSDNRLATLSPNTQEFVLRRLRDGNSNPGAHHFL